LRLLFDKIQVPINSCKYFSMIFPSNTKHQHHQE
jgi:hypothetical protein